MGRLPAPKAWISMALAPFGARLQAMPGWGVRVWMTRSRRSPSPAGTWRTNWPTSGCRRISAPISARGGRFGLWKASNWCTLSLSAATPRIQWVPKQMPTSGMPRQARSTALTRLLRASLRTKARGRWLPVRTTGLPRSASRKPRQEAVKAMVSVPWMMTKPSNSWAEARTREASIRMCSGSRQEESWLKGTSTDSLAIWPSSGTCSSRWSRNRPGARAAGSPLGIMPRVPPVWRRRIVRMRGVYRLGAVPRPPAGPDPVDWNLCMRRIPRYFQMIAGRYLRRLLRKRLSGHQLQAAVETALATLPIQEKLLVREGALRSESLNRQLAWAMAFVAGAVNAGGFLAVSHYTSHVTGVVSSMADELADGDLATALAALAMMLSFLAGAFFCTTLISFGQRRRMRSRYALTLVI